MSIAQITKRYTNVLSFLLTMYANVQPPNCQLLQVFSKIKFYADESDKKLGGTGNTTAKFNTFSPISI